MNFNDISKLIMNGEKIYNIPLRVCFYARVSTDSEVQINSLENQLNYYEEYIKSKPKWTYIDGYIDEGISGVRVEKRTAFKKMIEDAKNNKFDLIITKEVSRFARDLEDSIHYIRLLKEVNVGLYFENQNLNTFDLNSELILNIMFNLAQEESKKLSVRIKFGHRQAIKKGHVLGSSNIIGYRKDNCKLVIVEEEAELIKKIFELYSTGEYGLYKLSKKLKEIGYINKNGNLYDKDTLKRIISNPKYKGFYRGKTSEVIDYRTKKRIKIDENNQVLYKCSNTIIPPIVKEDLWDSANQILKARIKKYKHTMFSGGLKYPLSSKIYCGEHHTCFQRSKNRKNAIWCCSLYLQHSLSACSSPIILEKDLYNIFSHIINSLLQEKEMILEKTLKLYANTIESNEYNLELNKIKEKINIIEDKKRMIIELIYNGSIKKEDVKKQFEYYEKEINILNNKYDKVLDQIKVLNQNKKSEKTIYKGIKDELDGGLLEDFIRLFVDKIIVYKIEEDRNNIRLDINLNIFNKYDNHFFINKKVSSIEKRKGNRKLNKFTYNVFFNHLNGYW